MAKKVKPKIVFIQGAYEIINWGHIKAFQRAKKLGDYLIVALNSNELKLSVCRQSC